MQGSHFQIKSCPRVNSTYVGFLRSTILQEGNLMDAFRISEQNP